MDVARYESKEGKYFGFPRQDIAPLLADATPRVLEIGCGAGATLTWLKSIRPLEYTAGVELMAGPAEEARAVCDQVLVGDIERMDLPFQPASFDLILALDVLEHLVDPWALMPRLHALLKPGGHLIASLPNVAHYSVSLPLLRGRWTYVRSGILDATHLRFFVQSSVEQLLTCSGMVIDRTEPVIRVPWDLHRVIGWRRNQRLQNFAGRVLPHPFTYQFLMRAKNVTQ